jgi:hypothetical protein
MERACSIYRREEKRIRSSKLEDLKEKNTFKVYRRPKWEDNIKMFLRENWKVWTGLIWVKIRTGGRLLLTRE